MKRIIVRKNVRILGALFFASAILFYETHANVFLKEFAEKRLGNLLPAGTRVAIGNIEGGFFGNLVSEDVKIYSQEKPVFDIQRIEIDHRLWHPVLGKIPFFAGRFQTKEVMVFVGGKKDDLLNGFFRIEKQDKRLDVTGYLNFGGKEKFAVKGTIEEEKPSRFRITPKKGHVDLEITKSEGGNFTIDGDIRHVKINDIDFIGKCSAHINSEKEGKTCAQVTFKGIIIDYTPFGKAAEISLWYDKRKEMLVISEFKVNDEIKGHGNIRLASPGYLFLKWKVINLALGDYFNNKNTGESVSGVMNGDFTLKGPPEEPELSAHLDIQEGNFGTVRFHTAIGNLKGKGSLVTIFDSVVFTKSGNFEISGTVDLARLKDKGAFNSITLESKDNFFMWEGWSVKKEAEDASVKAEKFVENDISVSFKAETEDDESEEERFVGVERKVKF